MGEMRKKQKLPVGKPKGKRQLERRKRKWRSNIKINHREIWLGNMDWIHLAQDRV
jgi:hypothetical protein